MPKWLRRLRLETLLSSPVISTEWERRDPDDASPTMLLQGVLPRPRKPHLLSPVLRQVLFPRDRGVHVLVAVAYHRIPGAC
jgi:hypothetical protein